MNKIEQMSALINGQSYQNGKWVEIISPTTNEVIGQVPALTKNEIDKAYQIAFDAQKLWAEMPLLARIKVLNQWKELITSHKEKIADLMVLEIAKGRKAAITEVERSVMYIDYTFEEMKRIHPRAYNGDSWNAKNKLGIFEYVPKGVVLAISPFNYPVNLAISKIIPALVAGNSVVFKPASQGSLVGLYLAQLAKATEIPAGVFNAVSGKGSEIGDILVENPLINVISFTGSPEVGKHIASKSLKVDMILELGGKDPAIVLADADLEDTASKIIKGAFSYSGQRCTAIKRVLVDAKVKNQLAKILVAKVAKLSVGKPEDDCDITPVIDNKTVKYIQGLISDALKKGAKNLIGNKVEGNLMMPTLIDNVKENMKLAWEEPFGPVLPIISFKDIEQAISIANKSEYGLQAAIFTTNINSALSIAKRLETGTVNINDQTQRGPDHFPFTGIKDSGLGAQGIHDSLISFMRPKGIVLNWKD
ncbi:NADP-dependent glyceraldehyde-3-phosphate dehydrogenase [Spiroplasma platyhelix]|uniref:NADP-dependent glyceraldehyde-3-phosphate dehydrogenase n=1 Tax=Spiroplasma platyhelix PALS-1 TaxID=1276218 RepID=A0A846TXG2_9MOLU|nr:NADP-dependent glyceraldehyde-3-phosphate dehydrogenase [Spiroplasma platyhelix]MBE4704389.1 NADP-dependent glyceraldehyde-3-phosphate dehydrogenase [Spiroplasma platyhelix PALS-1]NKE38761.1 NADP-dependent glyceraldehyde-3-phosphate dehydrogenase [Spiroplasma platyhelix PALS-1]UJB28972.1 glyceraldehyde-3-phosphate dehydrogenase [Spiroplasma platyhelix PALS-1]